MPADALRCMIIMALAALPALAGPAPVADQQEPAAGATASPAAPALRPDPWRFEFTSWIWLMGLSGDVGPRGLTVDVDASFLDLLDDSDSILAFSGRAEIGYEKLGFYVDGLYADLGIDDESGPRGLTDIDIDFDQSILDFGVMYRIGDWEPTGRAAGSGRNLTLDLYAGGRYSNLEITFDPRQLEPIKQSRNWIDPIFGAKVVVPLSERWLLWVNGDVGGFGVSSDITWSTTGVLGYDFHLGRMPATLYVGYRAIGWDYSDGSGTSKFTWDITEHGPLLGLSIRF